MSRFERFAALYRALTRGRSWKVAIIEWAVSQMEEGVDTPHLRILAGLSVTDEEPVVSGYFGLVLQDIGEAPLDDIEVRLGQARALASEMISGTIVPSECAHRVHDVAVGPLNHPAVLQPWCDLDGGFVTESGGPVRVLSEAELDRAVLEYGARFLAVDPEEQLKQLRRAASDPG